MAKKFGWYSPTLAKEHGYFEYTNPDGEIVLVTLVLETSDDPPSKLDEWVYRGEVSAFIRKVSGDRTQYPHDYSRSKAIYWGEKK